jgi:hypothetical protein
MGKTRERVESGVWRAVLHCGVLHDVYGGSDQLRVDGKVFGIAACGAVCTLDADGPGCERCAKCFPRWLDQDTLVIPRHNLPKRIPRQAPAPRPRHANHYSDWFGSA